MLGAILRRCRWPVAYLGQAMPLDELGGFIQDMHPPLLVLVAMTAETAAEIADWPTILPGIQQTGKPIIGYGGRIFVKEPDWRTHVPGIYLGDAYQDGLAAIERAMT